MPTNSEQEAYENLFFACPFCEGGTKDGEPCGACEGSGKRQAKVTPLGYTCQKCWDTGWATRLGDDAGTSSRCDCKDPGQNPDALRDRLRLSGVGETEIEAAFEPWQTKAHAKIAEHPGGDLIREECDIPRPTFARDWLEWALGRGRGAPCPDSCCDETGEPRNRSLLTLIGPPGCGKSMTAAKLMAIYIKRSGPRPFWARVPTVIKQVMSERRPTVRIPKPRR